MEIDAVTQAIFDTMTEGILIINAQARIVYANRVYREFLRAEHVADVDSVVGMLLREVRPSARLPEVLSTGKPILYAPRQENNDTYFVNMYPICLDGVIAGGISVVTFIQEAYDFKAELERYEQRSRQVLRRINKANGARYTFDDIVAESPASLQTKSFAQRIAQSDATILLQSESGTGKELYAQAIHNASPRSQNTFVAINCASLNSSMLESELFGYVEGAFTGAKKGGKIGLFEAAAGGTFFLDEISELDLSLQSKLLRVLQEHRVLPVGAVREIEVDVRVITACNADLTQYVSEGKFRKDLYYRLNTFPICIPPLRERPEDIPPLIHILLEEQSRKLRRSLTITDEAVAHLMAHDWPGNIRELRNVLEFASYLCADGTILPSSLPAQIIKHVVPTAASDLSQRVKQFEAAEIERLLLKHGRSLKGKKAVAKELGISLSSLYSKMTAYS